MGAGDNIECNDDEGGSMDRGCALPSNTFQAVTKGCAQWHVLKAMINEGHGTDLGVCVRLCEMSCQLACTVCYGRHGLDGLVWC
jgi:hypothetical protein